MPVHRSFCLRIIRSGVRASPGGAESNYAPDLAYWSSSRPAVDYQSVAQHSSSRDVACSRAMPLLSFWKSARDEVLSLNIEQVVANAGDGNLRDSASSSHELREFLSVVPIEKLFYYARYCRESAFNKSGLVLQDVVNELGRRLEFDVENGLYQGKRNAVGFDGIWRTEGEPPLIVEVKTTDYVTVDLDKLAQYKERLTTAGK
jgi:hypothetical protein